MWERTVLKSGVREAVCSREKCSRKICFKTKSSNKLPWHLQKCIGRYAKFPKTVGIPAPLYLWILSSCFSDVGEEPHSICMTLPWYTRYLCFSCFWRESLNQAYDLSVRPPGLSPCPLMGTAFTPCMGKTWKGIKGNHPLCFCCVPSSCQSWEGTWIS